MSEDENDLVDRTQRYGRGPYRREISDPGPIGWPATPPPPAVHHPENDSAWAEAKRQSPSREPYTDAELHALRVHWDPRNGPLSQHASAAVVVWTLLDMIEEQKGWKV